MEVMRPILLEALIRSSVSHLDPLRSKTLRAPSVALGAMSAALWPFLLPQWSQDGDEEGSGHSKGLVLACLRAFS